ncbi:major capsid protein VP1 [Microviridae Bog9017_22]|uniref:major capsid protein VP1 n=1 Tax=Microviridae Bog9017_22 TaxID=1655651 RepID=UPI00063D5EE5|nr:major capsid protein VP1 [Microviridae Bog9017_22]AKI26894.1 major capsid protein VP1 [Microviridae Bog9017_22]
MSTQKIIQTGKVGLVSRPNNSVPSNTFDLSYDVKTSFNIGELIPIGCWEALPGDRFNCQSEALVRFAPMLAPIMQRLNLRLEYFFVPNRILWSDWEDFISPSTEGEASPSMAAFSDDFQVTPYSVSGYLGLPLTGPDLVISKDDVNCLRHAGYRRIYEDWYRDENYDMSGGNTSLSSGFTNQFDIYDHIFTRNLDRDYFTSSYPWPQKGADVLIPVTIDQTPQVVPVSRTSQGVYTVFEPVDNADHSGGAVDWVPDPEPSSNTGYLTAGSTPLSIDPGSSGFQVSIPADSSTVGTINDLRTAAAVQRWLEADIYGTRYIELIENHFATTVEDFRLQRAEFLGMTLEPIQISEVLQTSETATSPQGNMSGHGLAVHKGEHYNYHCKEHGHFYVIASVLPTNAYYQGVARGFSRFDRLDFAWPELANIGFQELLNKELFYDVSDDLNGDVFGYVPRYNEYRTMYSQVTGEFATNLQYWHMGRDFASRPTHTEPFNTTDPSTVDRVFAVVESTVSHLYVHAFHKCKVNRKLPRFSVPYLH